MSPGLLINFMFMADRDGGGGRNKSLACFIVGCRCVLLLLQCVPGQVYPLRLLTTNRSCKTHTHTHTYIE